MKSDFLPRLLRIGAFGALLAASATAALMPDWATTLKAQSYYGNVDLQTSVQPSMPTVRAGANVDFLVSITNGGPDDAHRARTHTIIRGIAVVTGTSGCVEDSLGYPNCTLSSALPASGSADYLMTAAVSPLARGYLDVTVAAESDDAELAPGNESLLLHLPIEARVDLTANTACDRSFAIRGAALPCHIGLRNYGPAASIPYFNINTDGATVSDLTCVASRPILCPTQIPFAWKSNLMMPGEQIDLWFSATAIPSFASEAFSIYASATAGYEETESHPSDNDSEHSVTVSLFRDSFE
jgi:hypothetical protein